MKGSQLDCMSILLQSTLESDWIYHGRPEYKTKPNLPDRACNFIGMNRSLILKPEKNLVCLAENFLVLYEVVGNVFMHQIILVK